MDIDNINFVNLRNISSGNFLEKYLLKIQDFYFYFGKNTINGYEWGIIYT
jgi:hypothetical protein